MVLFYLIHRMSDRAGGARAKGNEIFNRGEPYIFYISSKSSLDFY